MYKFSYRKKLLVYYFSIFLLFLFITGTFQYIREKEYRVGKLETTLDNITEINRKFIVKHHLRENDNYRLLDSLQSIIPQEESRTTIISSDGTVLYDSYVHNYSALENHINRPEIVTAKNNGSGSSIRLSASTGKDYYYFAKKTDDYFIRSAVAYDITIANFLKANKLFYYFIFGLFFLILIILWLVTRQFTLSVSKLKDFAVNAAHSREIETGIEFPNDEIGVIGKQITHIYKDLNLVQHELLLEKERLYRHLSVIKEGVALFSSEKKLLLHNHNFITFINLIVDKPFNGSTDIFPIKAFRKLNSFIENHLDNEQEIKVRQELEEQIKIQKDNKYYSVKCILFSDKSFELIISNITKREKNKIVKKEITANIAHELKTPLSAIHGYLETILRNKGIDREKKIYFIQKAFNQTARLNVLINDMTTVNKLEDAEAFYKKESVNLYDLITDIKENAQFRLEESNIVLIHDFSKDLKVSGNRELLYSIFQNLIENTINYAGCDLKIEISNYLNDDSYLYFSYSDSGLGIDIKHLNRIFERFYRVDSGRTRKGGGTGLGLSIVKNAIQFHNGKISAKSMNKGGLTFLFTLKKENTLE